MEEVFKKKLNFKEEAHLFSANIPKELVQEPVRQIALNEDCSALRFRKLAYIKTLSRRESMRLTKK